MKVLVWGIEPQIKTVKEKAKYLIDTADLVNINLEFIGVGETYTNFTNRLYFLQEYLYNIPPDEIVLVMDGYDTLINSPLEKIESEFKSYQTRILISAEKMFTYQWDRFKDKFDNIQSEYRYVNAGTFIGYVKDILEMLKDLLEINKTHPTEIDQGLMGVWVYNNFEKSEKVKLDTDCRVFWVTSKDWYILDTLHKNLINPYTGNKPCIIHNTGNSSFFKYFVHVYGLIMQNKVNTVKTFSS